MAATTDDLTINAMGVIEMKGKASSAKDLSLTYAGSGANGKILVSGAGASLAAKTTSN